MNHRLRPLAALCTTCLLWAAASARADDAPFDAQQRAHAKAVQKAPRSPESALELLEMQRLGHDADPAVTRALYRELADDARLDAQLRTLARHRLAWDLRREGRVEDSKHAFDALGYVRDFRVIGPFDNEGKQGFDAVQPVEEQPAAARDLTAAYAGRERTVRWRALPDAVRGGYVSFDALFSPSENVCGFAETDLDVKKAGPLSLWVGAGGAVKVYFNGQPVLRDEAYRGPYPNRHVATVQARSGANRVLVKVCATDGRWGFFLRTGDAKGEPLALVSDPARTDPVQAAEGKAPPAPRTWLETYEGRASAKGASAAALSDYARFLSFTDADDPAREWAKTYAYRAAEAKPTVERLLLAEALARERHERMRFVAEARELAPKDPRVQLQHALLIAEGPEPERALALLDAIDTQGPPGLRAVGDRASMRVDLGLPEAALALITEHLPRAPRSRRWVWARAEALRATGREAEALAVTQELLEQHQDFVPAHRAAFRRDLRAGDEARAIAHADLLRELYPAHAPRLEEVARMYEAAGRDDLKFAVLNDLVELNPQSSHAHAVQGRALLMAGRQEAAAQSFRAALDLSPQDANTRELLEQLEPEPRADEGYAVDEETLLARRVPGTGHPVSVLQNLTVRTVYENGLGSTFSQFAAQAHDEEGARELRARSIQFDPETQRVDVRLARVYREDGRVLDATQSYVQQLGEPWYRIYYDTRALVVVFPDLEPGDSVELRYRVDDVAHRNQFADYFGDLHFFGSERPEQHVEYVLMAPKSRELFFSEPELESLKHEVSETDTQRIHRYWVDDAKPLSPEPRMPGATEVLPYLHVSTYEKWDDVARWYWGLIKDQLRADDSLRATVAELKKGAPDTRTVVERVYNWVLRNTRYVGLEFGIHGFLPYRVPDIVRRGFGDCKDKASLIYTMLREAGIESRIVLLRTRRNGAIQPLPASLAVFDHAIAYVPELDLYLDGTAEHHGSTELPFGDQGVQVLLVGPDDSELRTTPVLPASANLRERELEVTLEEDGTAQLKAEERIVGGEAASYRSRYQAEGTRRERLQRSLAGRFPGLDLQSHAFTGLTDFESDVTLEYALRAPQFAKRDGGSLRLAPSVLHDLARSYTSAREREHPLELGQRDTYVEVRRVKLPAGHEVSRAPKGGKRQSPFGLVELEVQQEGDEIITTTRLVMNVARVPVKDYPEFRRWIQSADQLLAQRITISPRQP